MKKAKDQYIFSPSDLVTFMESPFASWMNRYNLEFPNVVAKDSDDASTKLLQAKGIEHERKYLQKILDEGKSCLTIDSGNLSNSQAIAETVEAMNRGYDVIYQGALSSSDSNNSISNTSGLSDSNLSIYPVSTDGMLRSSFAGFADFLVKVPGESNFGNYYYEPWDTKLANKPKPYFIIQLCCYAELLEEIQGTYPEYIRVVLGSGKVAAFATSNFKYFYRQLKQNFLDQQTKFNPQEKPAPTGFEEYRGWSSHAKELLTKVDHLCLVANITQNQVKNLNESGVTTLAQLASQALPPVKKINAEVLANLRRQAKLQYESRNLDKPKYELRQPAKNSQVHPLSQLPPANQLDVYFDMEGYPHVKGGLEYLFGVVSANGFQDWWAHNTKEEKQAFEQFIDWVFARYKQDPQMHIYHYGAYEISALRRLMGRYGTREEEVDELLRQGIFIDLYKTVRQSLIIGEPNYSIKSVEHIYRSKRKNEVATALDSVVFYNQWLENQDGNNWTNSQILKAIRDYNQVDCESTRDLTHWLRTVQAEHNIRWINLKEDSGSITNSTKGIINETSSSQTRELTDSQNLAQILLNRATELEHKQENDKAALCKLFAYLLEFYRRADKPMWWAMFDRHAMEEQELIDDLDCLAGLTLNADESPVATGRSSMLVKYHFAPGQDSKLSAGSNCYFAHDLKIKAQIVLIDLEAGKVTIKLKNDIKPPHNLSLIPNEHISSAPLAQAVYEIIKAWHESGELVASISNFLSKQRPQFDPPLESNNIINEHNDIVQEVKEKVARLKNSTICIQGPPGSGKSFTAAHTIVDLIAQGKKIAISSNTHKAIINLMASVLEIGLEKKVEIHALKVGGDKEDISLHNIRHAESIETQPASLIGGTAWSFAKPSCTNQFDYLFVDEAGQVSLANLLAMSRCAKNIVLIGDQMQLAQPTKGNHPGESGLSALEYLLGDHQTIPPELGIFLGITRRLHPSICDFISESFYENRLHPHPDNSKRTLDFNPPAGLLFIPTEHEGNTQSSDEEVAVIVKLVEELRHSSVNKEGQEKKALDIEKDILIVAPYNMQVQKLKQALPRLRIGTVDKFQGQEAPVVIVSMCASNANSSLRGLEFLLSKPRLNVAISRAQTLAIIVGNSALAKANCTTIEQMELVNNFCKIIQLGLKKDLPERVFL